MTEGLSMSLVGAEDGGAVRFRFEYTPEHAYAEQFYQEAVASMDPNNFVLLLQQYPYHVATLLQLAHVMRSQGDAEGGDALVQRALYAFECAWHPRFKPQQAPCRLSHTSAPEDAANRLFFDALWQRILSVARRGGFGTAYHLARFLLGLDPKGDPMAALLGLDYYALRGGEEAGLLQLAAAYEPVRCLALQPNMAFSLALAQRRLETNQGGGGSMSASPRADARLQQALALFPAVLRPLLDECGSSAQSASGVDWSKTLAVAHFTIGVPPASSTLRFLIEVYVKRAAWMWKGPHVLQWLHTNCRCVLERLEAEDEELGDLMVVAREQYPAGGSNAYRHLSQRDFTDSVDAVIPDDEPDAGGGFAAMEALPHVGPEMPPGGVYNPDPEASVLQALAESMMPWNHVPQQQQQQDPEDDAAVDALFDA